MNCNVCVCGMECVMCIFRFFKYYGSVPAVSVPLCANFRITKPVFP